MMSCPPAPVSILVPKDPRDRFRSPSPIGQTGRCVLDQPGALERLNEALTQASSTPSGARSPCSNRVRATLPIDIRQRSNSVHDWERPLPVLPYGGQPLQRWPSAGQTAASVVSSYRAGCLLSDAESYPMGPPPMGRDGLQPGDTTPEPAFRRRASFEHRSGRQSFGSPAGYSTSPLRAPAAERHRRTLHWAYSTHGLVRPYGGTPGSPPVARTFSDLFAPSSQVSPFEMGAPTPSYFEAWDSPAQPGGYGAVDGGQEVFFDLSEDCSEAEGPPSVPGHGRARQEDP